MNKKMIPPSSLIFGFLLTLGLCYIIGPILATTSVMGFAVMKTVYQHIEQYDGYYGCGVACIVEIIFWAMGAMLAVSLWSVLNG